MVEPLDSPYQLNDCQCIITALYTVAIGYIVATQQDAEKIIYIVAIGWLYVTFLMAFTEPSIVAGLAAFLFYGLLPVGLLMWLGGTRARRQKRAAAEREDKDRT